MPFGLPNDSVEQIRAVFAHYPEVRQAILYGSRAMGTQRDGSDIDLALTGKELTLKILSRIETELDDLLLPYEFDLSIRRQINNDSLLNHIERVGILFYERKREGSEIYQGAAMKKGWETKKLGEISAINYGYTESANSEPAGPRFLQITDIQDDHVDWDSVPNCKIASSDLSKYRLGSGDIVFARTGATTGKSFLVDDPPESVFASSLIRLRLLDKDLAPEFVALFFQTAGYWQSIKDGSAGSAQGGFNASKLGALSISYPPLPEQQRIVGLLDEAFEGIDTAKANAAKNIQNARALFESHLHVEHAEKAMLGDLVNIKAQSVGAGTKFLKLGMIKELEIELPNLAEQQRMVSTMDSVREETTRLAAIYQQKLAALEALKKSLLHKAFSGEL